MRALATADGIRELMRALGDAATVEANAYLTGGGTAVLIGWRETTIDVDLLFVPEDDSVLRAIPRVKDELRINVELASPGDFIPVAPGWQDRSLSVGREGRLSFYHYDPYMQALSKLERAHAQDLEDVRALLERSLVEPAHALELFEGIEPELFRFPAVDPGSFRRRVEEAFGGTPSG